MSIEELKQNLNRLIEEEQSCEDRIRDIYQEKRVIWKQINEVFMEQYGIDEESIIKVFDNTDSEVLYGKFDCYFSDGNLRVKRFNVDGTLGGAYKKVMITEKFRIEVYPPYIPPKRIYSLRVSVLDLPTEIWNKIKGKRNLKGDIDYFIELFGKDARFKTAMLTFGECDFVQEYSNYLKEN